MTINNMCVNHGKFYNNAQQITFSYIKTADNPLSYLHFPYEMIKYFNKEVFNILYILFKYA